MSSRSPRLGITGHRGVLGTCLQRDLPNVEWVKFQGDIRNYEEVRKWVRDSLPLDGVIHLAAMVPVSKVEAQPQGAFQTNVGGACHILEAVRESSQPGESCWVFLGSTSHVYASSDLALSEESKIKPISLYGFTKWQADELGLMYAEKYDMNICIGRIFSYSSALQPSSYFIPALIEKIRRAPKNGRLDVPGLKGGRDFLSTRQISEAIELLREKNAVGVYNIATGVPTKLLDVAFSIRRKLNREDVTINPLETGTANLYGDATRLARLGLKLQPEIDFLVDEVLAAQV